VRFKKPVSRFECTSVEQEADHLVAVYTLIDGPPWSPVTVRQAIRDPSAIAVGDSYIVRFQEPPLGSATPMVLEIPLAD
jgi:hypothetical protein